MITVCVQPNTYFYNANDQTSNQSVYEDSSDFLMVIRSQIVAEFLVPFADAVVCSGCCWWKRSPVAQYSQPLFRYFFCSTVHVHVYTLACLTWHASACLACCQSFIIVAICLCLGAYFLSMGLVLCRCGC